MSYTVIDDPSEFFQTSLFNGNAGTQSVVNDGNADLSPNLVWIKCRSGTHSGENHNIFDSVRGVNKFLIPNGTTTNSTDTNSLTAFNSDGYSLGSRTDVNGSGAYVGWQWKMGTSFTNDASSTGVGSIDSSGSVSTISGQSIVTWQGTGSAETIKHGLNSIPKMIMVKNLDQNDDWYVYHVHNGNTHSIILNGGGQKVGAYTDNWNNTTPTSSVFSVGGSHATSGGSGENMIAYCFSEVQGYSKIGSFASSGSAIGSYISTGFRVGWLMIKRTDSNSQWIVYDAKRNGFNTENNYILPSSSGGEGTNNEIDLYSYGFRPMEASRNELNTSGASYMYYAIAENPFTTSSGISTLAR